MIKAVIFDLDGTLINTVPDIQKAINAVLEDYGYEELSQEEVMARLGRGFRYLVNHSLPEDNKEDIEQEALIKFEYYYHLYYLDDTRPYPEIVNLLERLQREGILLAVNSNKKDEYAKRLVQHIFPQISFVDVLGMKEGIPGKPDPSNALSIIHKMGVSLEEVLYVGDSGTDYHTAQNASISSLTVTWGFRSLEELKTLGISCFADEAEDIYRFIHDKTLSI